jgi:hypothetical protein
MPGPRPVTAAEQRQRLVQPLGDLVDRERRHQGGRQLQGQRQTVQTPADRGHRRGVGRRQGESWLTGGGPFDEKGHRFDRPEVGQRAGTGRGQRQRGNRPADLAGGP